MLAMAAGVVVVFLSYATADAPVVRDVEAILKPAGCQIWDFDDKQILGGDWRQAVEAAIKESTVVVALISAAALKSPYVLDELAYARLQNKRIVAVPIRLASSDMPMIVARFVWAGKLEKLGRLCKGGK